MATDIVLDKKTKIRTEEPGRWKVIVLNDDYTPMDFVVAMMMDIFKHNEENAVKLTLEIHENGSALAGIYDFEIAEVKAVDSTKLARDAGFPLQIKIESE